MKNYPLLRQLITQLVEDAQTGTIGKTAMRHCLYVFVNEQYDKAMLAQIEESLLHLINHYVSPPQDLSFEDAITKVITGKHRKTAPSVNALLVIIPAMKQRMMHEIRGTFAPQLGGPSKEIDPGS